MIGETISHYRVLGQLGSGGMGNVYLAEDSTLERRVALKFLPDEIQGDPIARKRLLREAKSAAALDHPYICKVYEIGEFEGRNFIAMEHIEGETLAERLEKGALPPADAVKIAGEIAEALERAHEVEIVHRDLKPANIMLAADGHTKILDFGLAKQRPAVTDDESQARTVTALTQQGVTAGTLPYMSPEQLCRRQVDARSDVFSLGIVLYEMVTGIQPFLKGAAPAIAEAILAEDPPPLARHVENVPESLEPIVRKMLAKSPADRYQQVHEVVVDLARVEVGRSQPRRVASRWLVGGVAIVALAGGLVGVWWLTRMIVTSPQESLAFAARDWILITDLENLTDDALFDHSLDTALAVSLGQSRYVNVFPRNRVRETLKRMLREDVTRLDETVGREIALREGIKALLVCSISRVGESYSLSMRLVDAETGVTVLSESTTFEGRDRVLEVLDDMARKMRRDLGESLAGAARDELPLPNATTSSLEALKSYAEGLRLLGRGDPAGNGLLRRAIELDPEFALAHAELGMRLYMIGEAERGDEHFRAALGQLDRLTARERLWIEAVVEDWRGNRERAIENYRTYLAQYPDDSVGWSRLGYTWMITNRLDEAVGAFNRALELDPDNAAVQVNIATCLANDEARREEAVAGYEKAFAMDPRLATGTYINHEFGVLLQLMGDFDRAAKTFEKMLSEGDNQQKAKGHRSLALMDMYLGRYSAAIDHLQEAILLNRATSAEVSELRDRMYLAVALEAKGRIAESEAQVDAARRLQGELAMGPAWLFRVGQARARQGRINEAAEILAEIEDRLNDPAVAGSVDRSRRADQAMYQVLKGEIELARGDYDSALELFGLGEKYAEGHSLEPTAFGYLMRGDVERAIEKYELLRSKKTLGNEAQQDWIMSHYRLGKLYEQVGNREKAIERYAMLLEIWSQADDDLTAATEARGRLAALRSSAASGESTEPDMILSQVSSALAMKKAAVSVEGAPGREIGTFARSTGWGKSVGRALGASRPSRANVFSLAGGRGAERVIRSVS